MITNIILGVTILISILAFNRRDLLDRMIFNPYRVDANGEWYRFISSGMIHSDWIHLLINMFVLLSFGPIVEGYFDYTFGERSTVYYLLLYFGGMMTAILPTYKKHRTNPAYNALGASGAVSGIVFSFILFNPLEKLCLYGILCLPGILFGVAYLFYCYYMDKRAKDNINHDAHLWGAVYGMAFTVILKPALLLHFFDQLIYFRHAI